MQKPIEQFFGIKLPPKATTHDGVEFCPQEDVWETRDPITSMKFDFRSIPGASPQLVTALKAFLLWSIENNALTSTVHYFGQIKTFFAEMAAIGLTLEKIEPHHIINYRSRLPAKRAWYLSSLSSAFKKWDSLGYPGIDAETIKLLGRMRLKGVEKGIAVTTMDPQKGPFTSVELQSIQVSLNHAYAEGCLNRDVYALIWLFILLGTRPGQLAALKVCDLIKEGESDHCSYFLQVPRLKQRHQLHRSAFKKRPLRSDIGRILEDHVERITKWAITVGLTPHAAPMFPTARRPKILVPDFEWHCTSKNIFGKIYNSLSVISPLSERTGLPIHLNPYRFRYTFGTRAAEEGHGELVIAELLDHSDTQQVGIYVKATPAIIERLDKQLALQMAPLAQAFAGVLIDGKNDDSANRIVDLRFAPDHPIGGCGNHGFCAFAAPIACYSCIHFRPWLDGPHEAILDHLIAERERLMERGDTRIAAVNDRTILAVADVVRRCLEIRGDTMGQTDNHG